MTGSTFEEITRAKPHRSLLRDLRKRAGRNNSGRVTVRHRGGGHKRRYRLIDFKRNKLDIPARVESIEYDPNRSARIALLLYADGERRYIIAPLGLRVGDAVTNGTSAEVRVGNALPIRLIPVGSLVHNVELEPGRGGQLARAAGTSAQLLAKRASTPRFACPAAKCAWCTRTAWRPSARWATPSMATSSWAKLAASVGWAGGPPCAARRWTPTATRMAVVRGARPSVCRGRRHPGASPRWA